MNSSKKLIPAIAIVLAAVLSLVGTYTSVEASQRLDQTTSLAKEEITKDMSDFLGNYTMINNDGTVTTISTEQMDQILTQGSEVVEKSVVKEVAKEHLSRETLAKLEASIYEIVDMTMTDSDISESELALLKSSIASIVEQNVLSITQEYYEVSERNVTLLEDSIEEKIEVIATILDGYDKRLTEIQGELDTLVVQIEKVEQKETSNEEEVNELQDQVIALTSQLTNLQMKYESYTISSITASMIVDGTYEGNNEVFEYATKEALANSEALVNAKLAQLDVLIGEWNSNVTLSQAIADVQNAISQNSNDLEGKLKNLQTIFEMEIVSNKSLTDKDIKNLQTTISTLQATVNNLAGADVEALNQQKAELEQKLAQVANEDAQARSTMMAQINQLNDKISNLSGIEGVEDELENLINDASEELSQVLDTKIQTLQTQMSNSLTQLESNLGTWTEDTTISEYLIAAHNAIESNDANQTAQINAAKTALELQIASSKNEITEEQRDLLANAVSTLNAALADETADREEALLNAKTTLEGMISQSSTDLTGLMDEKVSTLTSSLNSSVSSINSNIDVISNTLGTWNGSGTIASALLEAQQNNSLLSGQLSDTNEDLQDAISSLNTTQSSLEATQSSLSNTSTLLSKVKSIVANDNELNGSYTGTLVSRMAVSEGLISSLQSTMQDANSDISTLQATVAANAQAIAELQSAISSIQSSLGDQVTFTVVDGVLYITTK